VACQVHGVEPGLINDAVEDSLLRYCHHPESYDPGRSRLDVFLALVAKRKLIDLLRHEKRRKALDAAFAASVAQTFDPRIIALPTPSPEAPDVRRLADHWSEPDRKFLEARLQGERRTRILAAILGLPLAPWVLQRQAVKRATDRLRVRLRRQLAQAQLGYRR
jgi:DNA-directed RNA polymerase specialized sigma24 family protein